MIEPTDKSIKQWVDNADFESLLYCRDLLFHEYLTDVKILDKYNPSKHTVLRALRIKNENMIDFLLKYKLTSELEVSNYRKVLKSLEY
jgi:hypothetical protein